MWTTRSDFCWAHFRLSWRSQAVGPTAEVPGSPARMRTECRGATGHTTWISSFISWVKILVQPCGGWARPFPGDREGGRIGNRSRIPGSTDGDAARSAQSRGPGSRGDNCPHTVPRHRFAGAPECLSFQCLLRRIQQGSAVGIEPRVVVEDHVLRTCTAWEALAELL